MVFGKPAIGTPGRLDLRALQTAISNTRERIEALEAALSTAQSSIIATQNSTGSSASAAQLASLQSQITALAARVSILESITFLDEVDALPFSSGVDDASLVPAIVGGAAVRVYAGDIARLAGGMVDLGALIAALSANSGADADMPIPTEIAGIGLRISAFDVANLLMTHPAFSSGVDANALVPVRLPNGTTVLVTAGDLASLASVSLEALIDAAPASSGAEADAQIPGTRGGAAYRFGAYDIANLLLTHSPTSSGAERNALLPARLPNGMTVLIYASDIAALAPTADLASLINGFSASSGAEANAQIPGVLGSTGLRMSAYDIANLLLTHSPFSSGAERNALVPVMLVSGQTALVSAGDLADLGTNGLGANGTYLSVVGGVKTWAISQIASAPAFSATPTFDTATADVFTPGAMTANITALNFTGTRPKVIVALLQDGSGAHSVTAGTSIDFGTDLPNLAGISLVANAYTYLGFVYHPTTTKYRLVALSK